MIKYHSKDIEMISWICPALSLLPCFTLAFSTSACDCTPSPEVLLDFSHILFPKLMF